MSKIPGFKANIVKQRQKKGASRPRENHMTISRVDDGVRFSLFFTATGAERMRSFQELITIILWAKLNGFA